MSDHLSNLPRENRDRSTSTSDHLSLLDVAVDFGHSAIYSGIQAPVTGFTQLIDKGLGTDLAGATALISAPRDSKFGTLDWHAQQVGGAIGMVLPFLAIHKVVGAAAGDSAFFSRPVATATSSGFLYGTVFQPSDSQGNFLGSRIKHGLVGGITFGTLAGVGQRLHNIAESGVVGNSLAKGVLENRAFSGVVSGAVAGTVGAQADALVSGKGIASGQDLFKSAYGYGMVGGLFGAMSGFDYKKATEPVNDTKTQPLTPADPQVKDTHTHPIEPTIVPQAHPDGVEVVLGAGGMRGFGLLGFLRYLEDKHVKIGTETGVSIGSIVAALHTNGYSSRRIEEIMKHELNQSSLKGLSGPSNPLRHPWQAIASHFVNMRTAMEGLVSKYQLEPNENLRIVAYNLATRSIAEGPPISLPKVAAISLSDRESMSFNIASTVSLCTTFKKAASIGGVFTEPRESKNVTLSADLLLLRRRLTRASADGCPDGLFANAKF